MSRYNITILDSVIDNEKAQGYHNIFTCGKKTTTTKPETERAHEKQRTV